MKEPDRAEEETHPTKAVMSEPQEEFIEPVARPSEDKDPAAKKAM